MPQITPPSDRQIARNQVLDTFRGFASLAVVLSHVNAMLHSSSLASAQKLDDSIGSTLFYLFNGSAVYFMIISGFLMGSNLPAWYHSQKGILIKGAQRITKILVVYWAAVFLLIFFNLLRTLFFGNAWSPNSLYGIISQLFFLSNFQTTQQLYIPPAWYLQADLIIFILVVALYVFWNRLPVNWRVRLRPHLFLIAIPILAVSISIEIKGPPTELGPAIMRLLLYLCMGYLAFHSQNYKSAFFSFLLLIIVMLFSNDRFGMDKRFYTSISILVVFIFILSSYLFTVNSFFNKPWMNRLYRLNFSIFLLHWFILRMGMNTARHLSPNSTLGLLVVLLCTFAVLLVVASLFECYVQQPVLRWHDKVWAYWLNTTSRHVNKSQAPNQA